MFDDWFTKRNDDRGSSKTLLSVLALCYKLQREHGKLECIKNDIVGIIALLKGKVHDDDKEHYQIILDNYYNGKDLDFFETLIKVLDYESARKCTHNDDW